MSATDVIISEAARELDARSADGIDVRLLWYPGTDTVTVAVFDLTCANTFEVVVDASAALDAFHHPFAYAAFQGIPYGALPHADEEELSAAHAPQVGRRSLG